MDAAVTESRDFPTGTISSLLDRVADDSLPIESRIAAFDAVKSIMDARFELLMRSVGGPLSSD